MKKSRLRPVPRHRSFRLSKKKLKQAKPVPGAPKLLKQTYILIKNNKKLLLGLALFNALITFIFIQGLGSAFSTQEFKQNIQDIFGNELGKVTTGITLFGYLLGTAGSGANEGSAAYQIFLTVISSLAIIWLVRQLLAGDVPKIRDGFYKGMYPLIPFMLIIFVIGLQLIPLLIGNLIYGTVIQNGLAVSFIEKAIWLLIYLLLAMLSLYLITSSVFALYISTLPDMTPMKALRSARELVLHRRTGIALRFIALPIILLIINAIIFIPLLLLSAVAAQVLFTVMISLSLVIFHTYMYLLYRSLL